jgi:biotin operon repressor
MTQKTVREEILEAVAGGCSPQEIAQLLGMGGKNVQYYLKALKAEGAIVSVGYGKYKVASKPPPASSGVINPYPGKNGSGRLTEHASRKVALPEYMRSRSAITLFIEHSPTEVEGVMRLEMQIGGIWIPISVSSSLRICVGDDIPRWSATQEVYNGVTAFRVTLRSGEQNDYAHNPQIPITVDVKP